MHGGESAKCVQCTAQVNGYVQACTDDDFERTHSNMVNFEMY